MIKPNSLRAAREFRDLITRWYVSKRDYPQFDVPPPEPPPGLSKATAGIIADEVERDVNRRVG